MTLCASCGHAKVYHEKQQGCALCISKVVAFSQGRYGEKAPVVCREWRER